MVKIHGQYTVALDSTNQRPLWHSGTSHPIVTIGTGSTVLLCATTTSIAFTDVLDQDESSSTLRPFAIAILFHGSLPCNALSMVRSSIALFILHLWLTTVSSPSRYWSNFLRSTQDLLPPLSRLLHLIPLMKKLTS